MNTKTNIFQEKRFLPFLALIAVSFWGCAYPCIKLGLNEFQIASDNIGGKTLFAGIRFFLAGVVVLMISRQGRNVKTIRRENWWWIIAFALVNTALHYFFFYLGLSNSFGSRASVLDALSTFLLVILACIIFPEEHMTGKKVLGCVLGFSGICILNIGSDIGGGFTLSGDGMMILNACCTACGGILTRMVCKKVNTLLATGLSLSIGGIMLMLSGILMGGSIPAVTIKGIAILTMLVTISAVGFSVYNQLLLHHEVGKVAIYNAFIPVFGILLSCLFLHEPFLAKYILAGIFVALGVFVINVTITRKKDGILGKTLGANLENQG